MNSLTSPVTRSWSLATLILPIALCGLTPAATLTYDANTGTTGAQDGAGAWNTTASNMWNGSADVAWPNTNADEVIFGAGSGAAGAVTVTAVTTNKITFNAAGSGTYALSGSTIALSGATPTITANADAAISSQMTGSTGLTKTGTGTLTVTGSNNYTGGTTVSGGMLQIGNGTTNGVPGTGTYAIAAGATLRLSYNTVGAVLPTWANYTGAGTIALKTLKNNDAAWGNLNLPAGFTGKLLIESGRPNVNTGGVGLGGTTTVEVRAGGHLGMWNGGTHTANFIVAGTGYGESGYEGALRFGNGGFTTTLNGTFTLAGDATLGASGGTGIISQPITEATPGLNLKLGSSGMTGIVEFDGANTYTGTTTVAFGTLRLANQLALQNSTLTTGGVTFNSTVAANAFTLGGLSGSGTITLVNTAAAPINLTVGNNNASTTFSGTLTGAGGLTKTGTGALRLTGVTSYSGSTTLSSGTLQVPTGTATTGACTMADGTTLTVAGSSTQSWIANSLAIGSSTGATLEFPVMTASTIAPIQVNNALTTAGTVTVKTAAPYAVGLFPLILYPPGGSVGGAGFSAFTLAALPQGVTANLVDDPTNGIISLNVSASNPLTWKGSPSSTWDVGTSTSWTLAAAPSVFQNGAITLFDDTATGSTTVAIPSPVSPLSVSVNNSSKSYVFSGASGITGSSNLLKSGSGTLTMINANTYTGLTTVNEGTLQLGDGTTDGSITAPVVNNAGLAFNNTGATTFPGALSGGATATVTKDGPGTVTLTGANSFTGVTTVNAGTLRLGNGVINASYSGGNYVLPATGRILVDNATAVSVGTWGPRLSGAGLVELNTAQAVDGTANWGPNLSTATPFPAGFTGTVQVNRGRIDFSATGGGGMTKLIIKDGAQFLGWAGSYPATLAVEIAGNGWGEVGQPGALRVAGANVATWAGPITLKADAGILSQSGGSVFTLTGQITGAYECNFIRNGNITVSPSSGIRNSYGSTRIGSSGGTGFVSAGNANAFSPGALVMDGGALYLNGFNFDFASLSGTTGEIRNNSTTTASTLTVGAPGNTTYAGTIINGSTATLALVKNGPGTLELGGASTYTGTTSLNQGVLKLNGGSLGNTAITVAGGATLTGAGTITGTVSVSTGGSIDPGNAGIGTLATGAGTLAGTLNCQVDTATADRVSVTGNLNVNGATIAFSTLGTPTAPSYIIASYTGTLSGTPAAVTGIPAGYSLDFATAGQIRLIAGYSAWAAAMGLDGTPGKENGYNDDPDKDGIANLAEFYFDGNPLGSNQSILPVSSLDATYLTLTFKRRDDAEGDVTGQFLDYGSTLTGWTSVALGATSATNGSGVVVTVVENGAAADDITVKVPRTLASGGAFFGRVRMTK